MVELLRWGFGEVIVNFEQMLNTPALMGAYVSFQLLSSKWKLGGGASSFGNFLGGASSAP